jgi:N4-gp56 family major capsid protein
MPVNDAYTSTGSSTLGGTAGGAGLVQQAYDRLLEFALRSEPLIRSVADKTPARQSIPGSTVVLQKYVDLAQKTSTLSETVDPDAVALSTPTTVAITLNEYGNSVLVTRALELFSLADVDPAIANIIAFNLADSIDAVAMETLRGGSNVIYSGNTATSTATLTAAGTIDSADVRKVVAKLRSNKAVARKGALYWAGIHPEVSHDLRAESSSGQGWLLPNQYGSSQDRIWAGEIGNYEGAFYIESPRLYSSKSGANQSTLATTAVTVAGTSAGFTFGVASSAVIATRAEVGDKINGTGIATDAVITAISTSGSTTTFTVATAHTAAVTATTVVTVTPVTRVFNTIIAGQQAMAQAVAEEPHVVIGPVVDKLMRHRPMGWYGVLGFARYREEALYRIESGSSIAAK